MEYKKIIAIVFSNEQNSYIFECSKFTNERKLCIDFVHRDIPNVIKYNNL